MVTTQREQLIGTAPNKAPQGRPQSSRTKQVGKILLIDDDPVFRAIFSRLASEEGIEVDAFDSMLEVEPFSQIASYTGVIFDYHLAQLDGVELASHLETIFGDVPMLLVSADGNAERNMNQRCPGVFGAFMSKKEGGRKIVSKIRQMIVSATHAN
jgi:DNA-binding NtrC family response regulator